MLDSIYVGMTGLQGYSQGLRVIANNTANINTPGFKGSSIQFADMFYSTRGGSAGTGLMQVGYGLSTAGNSLNFKQGELRQTGNAMDLAVDGQGLFTLRDEAGNLRYTRAGQFMFNTDGTLVSRVDGSKVMGYDAEGMLGEISIGTRDVMAGKATSSATFAGNLSSGSAAVNVGSVKVFDSFGGEHVLTVQFEKVDTTTWNIKLMENGAEVSGATEQVIFDADDHVPTADTTLVEMTYESDSGASVTFDLDFSRVTSFESSTLTSIAFVSQDGFGPASLTGVSFDLAGALVMAYANGQTVKGSKLALGRFDSLDAVEATGSNSFEAGNALSWHMGTAGDGAFGSVRSGVVELSNVDLSQEFSDLVIMQRGYQASSQIISTANEMLQELFNMKSK